VNPVIEHYVAGGNFADTTKNRELFDLSGEIEDILTDVFLDDEVTDSPLIGDADVELTVVKIDTKHVVWPTRKLSCAVVTGDSDLFFVDPGPHTDIFFGKMLGVIIAVEGVAQMLTYNRDVDFDHIADGEGDKTAGRHRGDLLTIPGNPDGQTGDCVQGEVVLDH